MPEDIRISELSNVSSLGNNDLIEVSQVNAQSETGYDSKKATLINVGDRVCNGIEYANALNTSNKKIIGAINEIASYTPVYGNTASGAIATFDTSLALPLQDLQIAINAVQESGTPTPFSPKLISGFTGTNIHNGINLYNPATITTGKYINGNGDPSNSSSSNITDYIAYSESTLIIRSDYVSLSSSNSRNIGCYDVNKDFIAVRTVDYNNKCSIVSIPANTAFIIVTIDKNITDLFIGSTSVIAIPWQTEAGTVYGGSLKVYGNGTVKLPVTHGAILLDGSQGESAFAVTTYTNYTRVEWLGYRDIGILDPVFMSDKFEFISGIPQELYKIGGSSGGVRCWLCLPTTITTKAEANTWFSNNPTFVRYPLATPVEYTLTSIPPIYTLNGTNNIFGDTNGDTSVVYACSLKDYIEGQ